MPVPVLRSQEDFPPVASALPRSSPAPGLLCAGADLSPQRLIQAYARGIFPWYSEGQPILWWSPDPRMVLPVAEFRLHRSMRKTCRQWLDDGHHALRMDHDFSAVIGACAHTLRRQQQGTWITPEMVQAYERLHAMGLAHSVECWANGELAGGLYLVNLGGMVFGESMFSHQTDASKFALCGLAAFCRATGIEWIDCQQNTRHLASFGAREMPRAEFVRQIGELVIRPPISWEFTPSMWNTLLD
jgi:leucyl/phenylalanyl-tRNA---protein transferase